MLWAIYADIILCPFGKSLLVKPSLYSLFCQVSMSVDKMTFKAMEFDYEVKYSA